MSQARHQPGEFYKWKAKYGGMDVSDARRLKQLEDENAKLKRLVADTMLDVVVLKACWESADDISSAAGSGTQGDAGSQNLAASGLRPGWCRSQDRAARTPA